MIPLLSLTALVPLFASRCSALEFTVAGGQIFTPGLAILDAPQPGTPLGGENLHVALDVSANGRLNLPPYASESPSQIWNISIFLYSYATGRNFTVTNVTTSAGGALGDIMAQEPGSTVKHINWRWPDCLVGDGQPRTVGSDRGVYNISIRQNFRLNDVDHYTVFDMPISVTNRIEQMSTGRPSCDGLNNAMMAPEQINVQSANSVGILFAPGDATEVKIVLPNAGNGIIGGSRPEAKPGDGLGGAGSLSWRTGAHWIWLTAIVAALLR